MNFVLEWLREWNTHQTVSFSASSILRTHSKPKFKQISDVGWNYQEFSEKQHQTETCFCGADRVWILGSSKVGEKVKHIFRKQNVSDFLKNTVLCGIYGKTEWILCPESFNPQTGGQPCCFVVYLDEFTVGHHQTGSAVVLKYWTTPLMNTVVHRAGCTETHHLTESCFTLAEREWNTHKTRFFGKF